MKKNFLLTTLFLLCLSANLSLAQEYDDLYYDPSTDGGSIIINGNGDTYINNYYGEEESNYTYGDYDDAEYEYADDYYDYYYTSRIRRFHRPYYGFSYFDPCYVDAYYYDPFIFSPGITIMIYDDYWSYRSWRRWQRWHRPWYNSWNAWGPGWYTSYNYYYFGYPAHHYAGWGNYWDPFYYSGSSWYCPPSWGNGNTYVTVNNNTYYGARRKGSSKEPRPPVRRNGIQEEPIRGGSSLVPTATTENRRTEANNGQTGSGIRPASPDTQTRTAKTDRTERLREETRTQETPNTRVRPAEPARPESSRINPNRSSRNRPSGIAPGNNSRSPRTQPNRSGSSRHKARGNRGNGHSS